MHSGATVNQRSGGERQPRTSRELTGQVERITDAVAAAHRAGMLDIDRFSGAMLGLDELRHSLREGRADTGQARAAVIGLRDLLAGAPQFDGQLTTLLRELA